MHIQHRDSDNNSRDYGAVSVNYGIQKPSATKTRVTFCLHALHSTSPCSGVDDTYSNVKGNVKPFPQAAVAVQYFVCCNLDKVDVTPDGVRINDAEKIGGSRLKLSKASGGVIAGADLDPIIAFALNDVDIAVRTSIRAITRIGSCSLARKTKAHSGSKWAEASAANSEAHVNSPGNRVALAKASRQ